MAARGHRSLQLGQELGPTQVVQAFRQPALGHKRQPEGFHAHDGGSAGDPLGRGPILVQPFLGHFGGQDSPLALNFGAGQALANHADLLGPVRRLMEAARQPWQSPPAGQERDRTSLTPPSGEVCFLEDGTGQANMDVGLCWSTTSKPS